MNINSNLFFFRMLFCVNNVFVLLLFCLYYIFVISRQFKMFTTHGISPCAGGFSAISQAAKTFFVFQGQLFFIVICFAKAKHNIMYTFEHTHRPSVIVLSFLVMFFFEVYVLKKFCQLLST